MQYPVNLNLQGRRVLVVGAGRIGARKIEALVACGGDVTVVAPVVSDEVEAMPVTIERRPYRRGEVEGYRLVVTTTDDPAVNRAVFEDAEAAGVWVNSADDPANCAFTLPAVVRRGAVMVTASTGGASPALSTWLRKRLEVEVGPEFAELAEALALERSRVHARGDSTEAMDWAPVIERELARRRRRPGAAGLSRGDAPPARSGPGAGAGVRGHVQELAG